jgi:hypothetical protein
MWRWHGRNKIIDVLIIILIIVVIMSVFSSWGFPWWIFFFVWPVFKGWNWGGQQSQPMEKPKRDPGVYEDPAYDDDKPKREPRYALGDDGELIELPAEDDARYGQQRQRNDYV